MEKFICRLSNTNQTYEDYYSAQSQIIIFELY
jgi:hypothetical protein